MTSELTPAEVHRRIVETAFTEEGLKYVDPDVIDHRGGAGGDHVGIAAWREKWAAISRGESSRTSATWRCASSRT
ncbi:hypothetical protein AB0F91_29750 [Amycolatopsis sp. NPDC023774]|uniref:hypothetical protein n=1 Tax=Amycolatopsis sp. NPDC023774 TaxID=3155015 RepID=UPI0033CCCFDC